MDTYQVEILEPGAKRLLEDLAEMDLITVHAIEPKKSLRRLLERMRSAGGNGLTPDEITEEVELVRSERYVRKADDPDNIGHKSLD